MQKKVGQKVAHAKLLAQVAMGLGEGDKQWARTISNTWNAYVRSMYYKIAEHENLEKDMQEEYKLMANFKPKVTLDKDGKATVTGIPLN